MIGGREVGSRCAEYAVRMRLGWGALAIAAVILTGCGGSGGSDSTTAMPEPLNTSTQLGAPAVQGGAQGARQFAGRAGERRFQALANDICGTVRTGAPPPLSRSATPAALRNYAAAAAKVNQRTIASLQRLGAPRLLRKRLELLLSSLLHLQSIYPQARSEQMPKAEADSLRRSIAMAEAAAGSAALAAGVPACAPHLPGAPG